MPFLLIFQFDGPDLVSERVYYDRLSMRIQLGVARDPNTLTGRIMTLLNHPVTFARAALQSRSIDNS